MQALIVSTFGSEWLFTCSTSILRQQITTVMRANNYSFIKD